MRIEAEMIPLEMNASKEVKPQLSWYLATPLRALERQVEAAFLSGNFMHSDHFSRLLDKIVVAVGADKDELATSMLLRILNRIMGNCSDYVTTLAMYENAAECYGNMEKTFLKEGSPIQRFLQLLLDNKLFAITVNSIDKNEGNIVESQCIVINLFADHRQSATDETMLPEIDVKLEHCEASFFSKADFKVVTSSQDFQNFQNFENESEQDIYASSTCTWNEKDDNNNGDEEQSISTVSTFHDSEITDECQGKEYVLDDATSIIDDDDEDGNSSDEYDGTTEEEEDMEEEPSLGMGCIGLKLDDEWENGSNGLRLQLVYDGDNKYYGFRIFLNNPDVDGDGQQDKVLVAGLFEKPIQRRDPNDELIDCGLKQVIGFVSCDKKNSWATMGMMDSASARSNCIFCTQPKSTYKTNFPDWMVQYAKEHGFENERLAAKVEAGWKDYPSRCGEHSNSIMFQKLEEDTNNGNNTYSEDELRDIRERHGCVINKPLLDIHPSKQTFGALHNGAGLENHFKNNIDGRLGKIDALKTNPETVTWLEKVADAQGRCKQIKATTKRRLTTLKQKIKKLQANIDSTRINVERAKDPRRRFASTTDDCVHYMQAQLASLLAEKEPVVRECGKNLRLHNGAVALLKAIEKYDGTKKPKGPAQWAFRKAIEIAGPKFNPQFGGMDLSHAHGLLMLEKWSEIMAMVCGAYKPGDGKHEMVAKAMEGSEEIATPLFKMNKLLKSQKKWNDEKINELKGYCYHVFFKWLDIFPKQGVFPKLHDMAWHIPQFVTHFKMYGILSEESMESRHIVHKKLARILRFMPNKKQQNEVFTNRLQVYQLPEFEKVKAELIAKTTKKKRGKYNVKPKDNVLPISLPELVMDGANIRINKSMSIKPGLLEVYNMVVCGIVPSSWEKIFRDRDDIDDTQKIKAGYSSQLDR
ncbi:unnamed protein product [Cylindrotheca closterium]|uniref:Uncharacterized protein n=3 Tax=Cylindrotheca closterium TaxID=2856 RepID=A0AAD2CYC8_9STRA|nr:unnamed protein product [Cylindrotheca closterium]